MKEKKEETLGRFTFRKRQKLRCMKDEKKIEVFLKGYFISLGLIFGNCFQLDFFQGESIDKRSIFL